MWPLINYLSLATSVMSMCLDNVTTILLITPVIIRICEVSHIKPQTVLLIVIMASNLAGTGSPVGDPPNIMIVSNQYLIEHVNTFF